MYDVVNMPDLVVRYFSSTPWLVMFIVSTVYLFFRLNAARKRAMFITAIVFLLCVNSFVIKLFTKFGQNSTYYRHLWAIPSIVIIGIAVVDFVRILPKWFLRISIVVILAICLWFVNEQEYVRCRSQILSTDTKLIPNEVIELGDELDRLRKERGKDTLFIVCPIGYERTYGNMVIELSLYSSGLRITDSSILNDSKHNGESQLMGEDPDVEYILSTCCLNGIDYVITKNTANTEKIFSNYHHFPVSITKDYLIYRCFGYKGFIQENTRWGQISKIMYYTENGLPDVQKEGYSAISFFYDEKGNKTEEWYYDSDGRVCTTTAGFAKIKYVYNTLHYCIMQTYLDPDGYPVNLSEGYSSIERTFEENGAWNSKKYLDKDGNLIVFNGCYETRREYNENKWLIRESYYDEYGQLMINTDTEYASLSVLNDEHGRTIGERYYDTQGRTIYNSSGYAGFNCELDEKGRTVKCVYLDIFENPVMMKSGYAMIIMEYDESGHKIRESFFDTKGNKTRNKNGFAEIRRLYDSNGNIIDESYYDLNGEKVLSSAG